MGNRERIAGTDILGETVSKRFAFGPVVIQPERNVSITSRSSSGPMEGRWNGIWRITTAEKSRGLCRDSVPPGN